MVPGLTRSPFERDLEPMGAPIFPTFGGGDGEYTGS